MKKVIIIRYAELFLKGKNRGFFEKTFENNIKRAVKDIPCELIKNSGRYLIDNFGVNVNAYDLITGYRADDSYFDYAESFINNGISVEQLAKAMRLGKLGEQIVIKSKFAFSRIQFEGFDVAEKQEFYVLRKSRDDEARFCRHSLLWPRRQSLQEFL